MNEAFINAAFGGALIGLSALILMYFYGRIAGVSGIFFGGISNIKTSLPQILFVVGLMLGASLYYQITHLEFPQPIANMPIAIIAGLLVGIGTKLGSGCTSGHGICGISRFSLRSISATLTFILFAVITVGVVRHVL